MLLMFRYEPSIWLNGTTDPILQRIWFDHQKSLSGLDSQLGNESSELVREVFIVHVGGTRCVTSSTDNNLKILARIT